MAETQALIDLISEYPTAFADPECAPGSPIVPNESSSSKKQELTKMEHCKSILARLEFEPGLLSLAASFLEQLDGIAELKQNVINEFFGQVLQKSEKEKPIEILDLPETYAREGSADCPSGMCPIDH